MTLEYSAGRRNQDEHVGPVWMSAGRGYLVVLPANDGGWSADAPYALRVEYSPRADLVYVPGGQFWMGSSDSDPDAWLDEKPQHAVYVDGFYMGRTEVTNAQYRRFIEAGGYSRREYWTEEGWQWKARVGVNEPRYWDDAQYNGPEQPVVEVSWYEADAYARWVGGRLPTEAEWEYAARGGPLSQGYRYAGSNDPNEVAWYYENLGGVSHAVAEKQANELGLYDMSGNVREWCVDWYDRDYYAVSQYNNPQGPASGVSRVRRGGSWFDFRFAVRCAHRGGLGGPSYGLYGFRVVTRLAP